MSENNSRCNKWPMAWGAFAPGGYNHLSQGQSWLDLLENASAAGDDDGRYKTLLSGSDHPVNRVDTGEGKQEQQYPDVNNGEVNTGGDIVIRSPQQSDADIVLVGGSQSAAGALVRRDPFNPHKRAPHAGDSAYYGLGCEEVLYPIYEKDCLHRTGNSHLCTPSYYVRATVCKGLLGNSTTVNGRHWKWRPGNDY